MSRHLKSGSESAMTRPSPIPASVTMAVAFTALAAAFSPSEAVSQPAQEQYQAMDWRLVGPFRGGRVTAVTGHRSRPETFFMGTTGGGVWKTDNSGTSWRNVSDGYFDTGSVGAIAVAPSNPDVVYVGMGEEAIRGVTTSHGDGIYKSVDGGETWTHLGLADTRHIAALEVHPRNPDRVVVAAQGSPWAPSEARGVYLSTDGGQNWERTFFVNETTGASSLAMDPNHPHVLYVGTWDLMRQPWNVRSGGPGSGLYRSTDGGRTWTEMTSGLPDLMGNTAVTVSPADSDRLWAMIEAEEGGVYRSDDGGDSWQRVNSNSGIRDRGWYYTNIYAHPSDRETVYVLAAPMARSTDGGETFEEIDTPHGDNHDLWINPERPEVMVEGNDGGANVTTDGGDTWSTQFNQPTGQFYRVITDSLFPYSLYAGQQDNSTIRIPNRTLKYGGIGQQDWEAVGGGESAFVGFDRDDPTLIYATSILGGITEYDTRSGVVRDIAAYPYFAGFRPARELKYRYNWNAPVVVSQHDPGVIYHAAQVVLKSTDRGRSWSELSSDLTRNDTTKQGTTGGPIMIEGAGGEHYSTITYLAESPHDADVLWTGSDDGLVHVTRDGGENWHDVTPSGLPESQVNAIEVSPHDPASVYIAVYRYKRGDFSPIIYRTDDYGASWEKIVDGLPESGHFVRVVREDPVREGLLYAGTEGGVFVSFDDGDSWQPLQLDLPVVPVTDLRVRRNDLVASTQGRGFWVLDGLGALRQADPALSDRDLHLFEAAEALRLDLRRGGAPSPGENPPYGAVLYYSLSEQAAGSDDPLTMQIIAPDGDTVRSFTSEEQEQSAPRVRLVKGAGSAPPERALPRRAGQNRFVWNLRVEDMVPVGDTIRYVSNNPYRVAPGRYEVRLSQGDRTASRTLHIRTNPRAEPQSEAAWNRQQELARTLYELTNSVHRTTNRLRSAGQQARDIVERIGDREGHQQVARRTRALVDAVREWQSQVPQPPLPEGRQDRVAYPSRLLSTQILHVLSTVDQGPPVSSAVRNRVAELEDTWKQLEAEARSIREGELADLNETLEELGYGKVVLPPGTRPASRL